MKIVLEAGTEGPYKALFWQASTPDGKGKRITGQQASMISMILSGYVFKPDFHPFDAFTQESLDAGSQQLIREGTSQ